MIDIDSLSRTYEGKGKSPSVNALDNVSLRISEGEIFGVLGPNGAGKTTLIRILSTLLTPTSGRVSIAGHDVVEDANVVRNSIGVAFGGERGLYDRLNAEDNLRFACELYRVNRGLQSARIAEVLELVDLTDKAKARVETFSRGMKQRLHIARALVHRPAVLFLDEPSTGLDPIAARSLRQLVRMVNASGTTVVLTTHLMFEADELCGQLAVIRNGQIVRTGSPDSIKSSVRVGRVLEIDFDGDATLAPSEIGGLPGVSSTAIADSGAFRRLTVRLDPDSQVRVADVLPLFGPTRFGAVVDRQPTLEDAYVSIVEGAG